MTHNSHVKFISFNATMLNGSLCRRRRMRRNCTSRPACCRHRTLVKIVTIYMNLNHVIFLLACSHNLAPHHLPALYVDCTWSEWIWESCSKSCGNGTEKGTRTIAQAALHGGKNCTGPSSDTRSCNTEQCPGD